MARMFPNRPRSDTDSRAELELFDLFERSLPDSFHVFHGVAWQSRSRYSGARDGEADFVIVHPAHGICVLEAKSGNVTIDGRTGQWIQNQHTLSKSPLEQARRSLYFLKQTLEENGYWRRRDIVYAYGMALPHVPASPDRLSLDAPRPLIFYESDMQHPEAWLKRIFDHYRGERKTEELDRQAMENVINLLAPTRELRSLMSVDIQNDEADIVRLTERQYRLLDFISNRPRAAISGCAGSGKTMLACEKAQRLARQGWRVLLTCFNRNLASFLREDYLEDRPAGLRVQNFHDLAVSLVRQTGRSVHVPQEGIERSAFFRSTVPSLLADAADELGPQFDAIIVDEGQDFLPDWWLPLQLLLQDPDDGTLYIFFDDNQNLYGGLQSIKNMIEAYPLNENCRNTQTIFRLTGRFYSSPEPVIARGPLGREVEVASYNSEHDMLRMLKQTLQRLVHEERVPPEDIVILTPAGRSRTALNRAPRVAGLRLTPSWPESHDELMYSSIHSFKGLESPVVILVEAEKIQRDRIEELLYVACSRARSHLVILSDAGMMSTFGR